MYWCSSTVTKLHESIAVSVHANAGQKSLWLTDIDWPHIGKICESLLDTKEPPTYSINLKKNTSIVYWQELYLSKVFISLGCHLSHQLYHICMIQWKHLRLTVVFKGKLVKVLTEFVLGVHHEATSSSPKFTLDHIYNCIIWVHTFGSYFTVPIHLGWRTTGLTIWITRQHKLLIIIK